MLSHFKSLYMQIIIKIICFFLCVFVCIGLCSCNMFVVFVKFCFVRSSQIFIRSCQCCVTTLLCTLCVCVCPGWRDHRLRVAPPQRSKNAPRDKPPTPLQCLPLQAPQVP